MSTPTNPELAVSYATLILADDSLAITPEKLQTLLKAAGIEDVEPIWTTLFAKALEGKDVKDILTTIATSGPAIGEASATAKTDKKDDEGTGDDEKSGVDDGDDSDMDDLGLGLFG
jgi:large subunit ribosomal protein LP1